MRRSRASTTSIHAIIGTSRGVRLPKPLIPEAGLGEDVESRVQRGTIVIARAVSPRSSLAEAATRLRKRGEDTLLDPPLQEMFAP